MSHSKSNLPWIFATVGLAGVLLVGLFCSGAGSSHAASVGETQDAPMPQAPFPCAIRALDRDGRARLVELDYGGRRHAFLSTPAGIARVGDYPLPAGR